MKISLLGNNKLKKFQFKKLILALLLISFSATYAQKITVKGVVKGGGDPLPQATINIKGTKTGTISDFDGNYIIQAKRGDILVFSYLGFSDKEVKVTTKIINVDLEESASTLDEVVVVGYGTQKKKEVTGAVAKVNAEEILKVATPDLTTALQGKVAGVNIQAASGSPGENANIQIRGVGSLSEGALGPLYVVDGVPYDDNPNISPEQIESIDILKDGASASIYGVRASNGVILITTKRGKEGKPRVSFNSFYGIQNITSATPLLNVTEQLYQNSVRNTINGSGGHPLFGNRNAYNNESSYVDAIQNDNAPIQNYALNISGGSQNFRLNFNTNYYAQEGVLIASRFNRLTNRLTARFNKGKFAMFASVNLQKQNTDREPWGLYERSVATPPWARDISDLLQTGDITETQDQNIAGFARNFLNTNEQTVDRTNIAVNLEYEFIKGLKYKVNLGKNNFSSFTKQWNPQFLNLDQNGVLNPQGSRINSQLTEIRSAFERRSWENILTYNTKLGKHSIGLLGVLSYEDFARRNVRTQGLFPAAVPNNSVQVMAGAESTESTGTLEEYSLVGKLFRLQYNYDGKYLFSGSLRRDGSSRFAEKNRYETFFGLSAGWNIHEEDFMQDIRGVINSFKFRASYAQLGNQNIGFYRTASIVQSGVNYPFGTSEVVGIGFIQRNIVNEDLKWETAISSNIGFDMGFFNNKLQITMDVYKNEKEDMLLNFPLPGSAGVNQTGTNIFSTVAVNAGDMTNEGYEFSANYKDRTSGGLKYSIGYTFTTNKNTVTNLNGIDRGFGGGVPFRNGSNNGGDFTTYYAVGREAGAFFLLENMGVIKTDEQLADYQATLTPNQAQIFQKGDLMYRDQLTVDTDGDGIPDSGDGLINDDDLVYRGSGQPDFEMGLNTDFSYKNFDLAVQAYFAAGAEIYNGARIFAYRARRHKDLLDMWSPQNPTSDIPTERGVNSENVRARSDYFLEDGTYLRIRALTFGYTIPKTRKLGINKARVYFTSVNPFTFTKYRGYDPEVGGNGLLTRGVDVSNYPVSRQFSVGVQLVF